MVFWTGDVEPVPFPFRGGMVGGELGHLCFDDTGRQLIAVGRNGDIHRKSIETAEPLEVLPRSYFQGRLLREIVSIDSSPGGFEVRGRFTPEDQSFASAFYRFSDQSVRVEIHDERTDLRHQQRLAMERAGDDYSKRVAAISRDGRLVARQVGLRGFEVRSTNPPGDLIASHSGSGFHTNMNMTLNSTELGISIGKIQHRFQLTDPFEHDYEPRRASASGPVASALPGLLHYDPNNFMNPCTVGPWTAVVDGRGQVVLHDRRGKLVLLVTVRRALAAICLPDGTRWGAAELHGGPAPMDAIEAIEKAIRHAREIQ